MEFDLQLKKNVVADNEERKKTMKTVINKPSVIQEESREKPDEWTCMVSFGSMKMQNFC